MNISIVTTYFSNHKILNQEGLLPVKRAILIVETVIVVYAGSEDVLSATGI